MIDSIRIKESIKTWKYQNERSPSYNEYIEGFLEIYLQKVDLYNIYRDNEDCIWLYPLRTLYEMLLKFEYFVSQNDENRVKIANNSIWKFAKDKNFDEDFSSKKIENYYIKLSESDNKGITDKIYELLDKSTIFPKDTYIGSYNDFYRLLCGFTHGEYIFSDTVNLINNDEQSIKSEILLVEDKLSQGLINLLANL